MIYNDFYQNSLTLVKDLPYLDDLKENSLLSFHHHKHSKKSRFPDIFQ